MKYFFVATMIFFSAQMFAAPDFKSAEADFKNLLGEMVAAKTVNPPGNESRLVRVVAERLKKEGIAYEITEFEPGRENIVARLKGNGKKKPMMILAHSDVVGTTDQIWSQPDPHKLVEREGYLYGRGVADDLGMGAATIETLILLKKSGITLDRDVIVALTGGEETSGIGLRYLIEKHPEQIDAEFVINEGGGFYQDFNGKLKMVAVQVGEKVYEDLIVTAKGATGHSSVPVADNAIYKLARALTRLEKHSFPIRLSPIMRSYIRERAAFEKEPLASAMRKLAAVKGDKIPADVLKVIEADVGMSTLVRTTCVATIVKAGSKENALAPIATANVNCRMLPEDDPKDVLRTLAKVMGESDVEIKPTRHSQATPASPIHKEVFGALEKILTTRQLTVPIVPTISKGATDSRYLRQRGIPCYGVSTIALTENDARLMHGVDERIPSASIRPGLEMMYELVTLLAGLSAEEKKQG
jgi:acetylornithine deacetylase/succinyl-diaminopimelate desuccinylase-like protein